MKNIKLLIFLPLIVACSNQQSKEHSNNSKLGLDTVADIYNVTAEDTAMNRAIDKARQTIRQFDSAFRSGNKNYTAFAVKKRYGVPGNDGGEHMWVAVTAIENGRYKGYVNNDAEATTEVKYGDSVQVGKDEITDWMFLDRNLLKGGYTIRAIRNHLSKEERINMDNELGFTIEE